MKAANLLISNDGSLRIADFGLARAFDPSITRPRRSGTHTNTKSSHPSHSSQSSRSAGPAGQWTLQAIITKADTLRPRDLAPALARIRADLFSAAPTCLPPIVTAAAAAHDQLRLGVDEVRASIAEACGLGRVEAKVYSTRSSASAGASGGAGAARPPP